MSATFEQTFLKPGTTVAHASLPEVTLVVKASRIEGSGQICKVAWVDDTKVQTAEFPAIELAHVE